MDLRHLSPFDRQKKIERELGLDLSSLSIDPTKLGNADQKNCEQMFGHVPIPVGYAGPLPVTFSSGETTDVHLPLATTEGALVASVNRGCKALRLCGGVKTTSVYHGVSRSIALQDMRHETLDISVKKIREWESKWKSIGEATSSHLKILKYDIDTKDDYIFLTIYADTDEAMGMNMVTIAADAIGKWLAENLKLELITVAANIDSDKKPSQRTHDRGRGYEVHTTASIPSAVISTVLKTTPDAMLEAAHAKLDIGSNIAGALGKNLHAANIIAALYIATGQDPGHVVEGSLGDTIFTPLRGETLDIRHKTVENSLKSKVLNLKSSPVGITISTHLPALLVGIRGGGTTLPAQSQCLKLLLKTQSSCLSGRQAKLKAPQQLAEIVGAAVLAGELSLLAAQASHHLAKAHRNLARKNALK